MSDHLLPTNETWLLDKWLEKFLSVIVSMTEVRPVAKWETGEVEPLGENSIVIEQRCAESPEPILWVAMPEGFHQELGRRILLAAGVDTEDAEENRATTLEIVEQATAGLTSLLVQRLARDLSRRPSSECASLPPGLAPLRISLTFGETALGPFYLAFSPSVTSWMDGPFDEAVPSAPVAAPREAAPPTPVAASQTMDLLLDVALPVSVSFGKTELAVRDVLKLTTGSIVELNRAVSEPVDIVVNNCIIARGEVVVVDGNYGVRIQNIVSRRERLRTGGAQAVESKARVSAG